MQKLRYAAETVPVVETERLKLRRHQADDFDACAAMWGDPAIARFIGGKPFTREDVWARLLRYVGHWSLLGFGFWAIEEKSTGHFIGEIGLADFQRDIEPPITEGPEAGWALMVEAHGKGYASEALRAVLGWGEANLADPRVVCMIDDGNNASVRVAEKCGFRSLRPVTYKGKASQIYVRDHSRL